VKSREPKSQSQSDLEQFSGIAALFEEDPIEVMEKLDAFPRYVSRQAMAKFLTKYEIFKRILHINGSIIECGVLHGAGLLAWAKLSNILEPVAHPRRIIGFDTFEGFPGFHAKDKVQRSFSALGVGGLKGLSRLRVEEAIKVYDLNRPLSHIPKVELVEGDLAVTAPKYLEKNPHLVVALINLDLDLYEPTKVAIETFLPRMPKGAVIVFDELNAEIFPGETRAVLETVGLRNLKIERFPFDSYVSFAVLD
jgi:macrocin-O-methyltransferase TylF-like protien